jgi:hypothetical protein
MSIKPVDLTGGKSVYCFNESQLDHAFAMYEGQDESGDKIRAELERLEGSLSRNERASLAFVIIDRLNKTSETE